MKAAKLFYEKLYTNVDGDTNNSWIDEIKDSTEIPQISENDKLNMRKPISKDDLFAIMKTFSKKQITRKRWIDSGILWKILGLDLGTAPEIIQWKYWNGGNECITETKHNYFTRKRRKDKLILKKWRPISLMNFDTKLFSKTLATRLKKMLPTIIHPNQVAYVKDSFIGEGIRLIDSVMDYTR